jgi:hypothetical protein
MVGRAEIAQARMRLAFEPRQQVFSDARLTDAGLPGEQYNPTLTGLGLIPPAQQQWDSAPACRASNRLTPTVSPRTRHASTEGGSPFSSLAPSAWQSNIPPTSRRVLAAITTSPGAATACSRAARFGVSAIRSLISSRSRSPVSGVEATIVQTMIVS